MTSHHTPKAWLAVVWMIAACVSGCSSSDANLSEDRNKTVNLRRAGDQNIVPKHAVPDEYRPVDKDAQPIAYGEKTYDDGAPTHYADGSPAYMPDGSPIDYRPRNIQRQLTALPKFYARDIGQETLGAEGPTNRRDIVYLRAVPEAFVELSGPINTPIIDAPSGELAWPILQCNSATCLGQSGGQALRFIATWPAVTLDETGQQIWLWPRNDQMMSLRCPQCGRTDHLSPYTPPAVLEQERALRAELSRVRASSTQ